MHCNTLYIQPGPRLSVADSLLIGPFSSWWEATSGGHPAAGSYQASASASASVSAEGLGPLDKKGNAAGTPFSGCFKMLMKI